MLDIKLIRDQPELVRNNLEKRKKPEFLNMLDTLIDRDEQWRKLKMEIDSLRQKRNQMTDSIKTLKKEGKEKDIPSVIAEAKTIPEQISKKEQQQQIIEEEKNSLLLQLPNLLHETVPYGQDDTGNLVERT